jgi:multiple RNA-binding domain-containing protein 1
MKSGLVDEDPSMETVDVGGSQTVYVKNLNFSTSEEVLEKAFTRTGFQPRAVKIPMKTAPLSKFGASSSAESSGQHDRQLSMGFGFVEFPTEEVALKAMKAMQGKVVDGHALDIKLSTKTLSKTNPPGTDKSSMNTKIIVRNVPFEASRTELLQLFGSFGHLKKVRLPKKFDGTHRGFAFCEFLTSKEAQNAMTTLSRTHLYGRHLVLEWAEASDEDGKVDVDAVREKAKRDAMRAGLGGNEKKRKHLKF